MKRANFLICGLLALVAAGRSVHPAPSFGATVSPSGDAIALPDSSNAAAKIVALEPGIAGAYKAGSWMPVRVTLDRPAGESAQIAILCPDPDKTPVRFTADCGGKDQAVLHARIGRTEGQITAQLIEAGRVIDQRAFHASSDAAAVGWESDSKQGRGALEHRAIFPPAVGAEQPLILIVGDGQEAVEAALRTVRGPSERRPRAVSIGQWSELPAAWYDYEAIDTVILAPSDPKWISGIAPDDAPLAALDRWVRLGGRLLLCVGRQGEAALGDQAPFARFAPGPVEQMVTLRDGAEIEMFAGSNNARIVLDGSDEAPWLRLPYFAEVEGHVEVADGTIPLVICRAHGLGTITFFAGDPGLAPLADWKDVGRLLAKLLDLAEGGADQRHVSQQLMHLGYSDLAGQLRSALDRFDGVRAAPFTLVVLLIVVYLALIGPVDYLLVHRILKRPILTWVTLPVYVLLFCIVAVVLSRALRSPTPIVHQADLVDVDVAAGRLRGTSWANIYSPSAARYDVAFEPQLLAAEADRQGATVLTSWFGLTGSAIGGMDSTTLQTALWREPCDQPADLSRLVGAPMETASTRSFTGRWVAPTTAFPHAEFVESGGVISGSIMNTLDFPLQNCLLVHGGWAYQIGDLPPGGVATVGTSVKRRELGRLLTDTKLVFDERKSHVTEESTPYSQASVDVEYILRAMMFYQSAGGRYYTGLGGQYQAFVDMSDLLKTNRAVLVATVARDAADDAGSGAKMLVQSPEGESVDRRVIHTTICRFVFPVTNEDAYRD